MGQKYAATNAAQYILLLWLIWASKRAPSGNCWHDLADLRREVLHRPHKVCIELSTDLPRSLFANTVPKGRIGAPSNAVRPSLPKRALP